MTKALILAAGVARRLYPFTREIPKCLIEIGPRTILDYQLSALRQAGVRDAIVVVGYRREQVMEAARALQPDFNFEFVVNHHFYETNTAYSLWLAGERFAGYELWLMNGDVYYPPAILDRLRQAAADNALAVDAKPCQTEEVKVTVDDARRILLIGKELDPANSLGEFIGVARFRAQDTGLILEALGLVVKEPKGESAYFEAGLQAVAGRIDMRAVDITGLPAIEVDFPQDLEAARRLCEKLDPSQKPGR